MRKFFAAIRDILLWFVRDHNGKPSSTRLVMLIITIKAVQWGDHLVYNTQQGITDNLLYLLGLCVLGTAFFMKMVSPKQLLEGLVSVFTKKPSPAGSQQLLVQQSQGFVSTAQSADWWKGGLSPQEQAIEDGLNGPGRE